MLDLSVCAVETRVVQLESKRADSGTSSRLSAIALSVLWRRKSAPVCAVETRASELGAKRADSGKEMGGFLIALAAQFKLKTFPVFGKSFQFRFLNLS